MNMPLQRMLVGAGILLLYLLPLVLLWWGFRSRRRWRQARGLESPTPTVSAPPNRSVAEPPRSGFHIAARQVALVYGCYVVLLAAAVVSRRYRLALLPQSLYLALLAVTWWSALSPRQYAIERSREPGLTRRDYIGALIGFFGVMPLALWLVLGLPALRFTMAAMRGR